MIREELPATARTLAARRNGLLGGRRRKGETMSAYRARKLAEAQARAIAPERGTTKPAPASAEEIARRRAETARTNGRLGGRPRKGESQRAYHTRRLAEIAQQQSGESHPPEARQS